MVLAFDFTDCFARAPHYNRIRGGTLGAVPNPLQKFTVSNPGSAEEVVVPSDEISSTKDSAQVMSRMAANVSAVNALDSTRRKS